MWLIDENLHTRLHQVLRSLGREAQTVTFAGFSGLDNGLLVTSARDAGFSCILTQDRDFPKDAQVALRKCPELAIVVIRISQTPPDTYLVRFEDEFKRNPISPVPGKVEEWPTSKA